MVTLLLNSGGQLNFYRGGPRVQGPKPRQRFYMAPMPGTRPSAAFPCVERGYDELVWLLLERSADAVGYQPSAPKLVVLQGHPLMVYFLLNDGFRVREYSHISLFTAIWNGQKKIVDLLQDRGATLESLSPEDERHWDEEDSD